MSDQVQVTNHSTGTSASAGVGDMLRDIAQNNNLGIPFGCENGICATCLIQIRSGGKNLSPIEEQEQFTLETRAASENHRLACQCKIVSTENGNIEFDQGF